MCTAVEVLQVRKRKMEDRWEGEDIQKDRTLADFSEPLVVHRR
jgi:hypothetical protein